MIRFDGVRFRFGPHAARDILHSIDLTIDDGEWIAVTGANGSGKSVLAKLMAGLYDPDSGEVLVDGAHPRGARGRGGDPLVGIAFQNPDSQFVTTTARREILFGLGNIGVGETEAESRAREAAAVFELEPYLQRNPHMLSGGEKQRLLLACIWAMRPRHVILDEPFSFLDAAGRGRALEMVRREFHDEGRTVVWATLDPRELELADRVICLDEGEIVFDGSPSEALSSIPDGILTESSSTDPNSWSVGGGPEQAPAEAAPGFSVPPVMRLTDARLSYGAGGFALDIGELSLDEGDVLGLMGPSGSGKTALLLGCSGLLPLERGRLTLFGENVACRKDFPAGRIAFLFQSPEEGFFAPTVEGEIALGHRRFGDGRSDGEAAREILARVGLDPDSFMNRSPFHLSQGEKRLVALASQLVLPAELVLLDEPALFLDGRARSSLVRAVEDLIDRGVTIAVASHDTSLIESFASRTVTLADGSMRPGGHPGSTISSESC